MTLSMMVKTVVAQSYDFWNLHDPDHILEYDLTKLCRIIALACMSVRLYNAAMPNQKQVYQQ